jgi:hypothetical protein
VKGLINLRGCAVSLVPYAEVRHFFCFRVVTGLDYLVMQAKDEVRERQQAEDGRTGGAMMGMGLEAEVASVVLATVMELI